LGAVAAVPSAGQLSLPCGTVDMQQIPLAVVPDGHRSSGAIG
jgi:hypothetical protein